LWWFKGRSFGRTTQHLVFARVLRDSASHLARGERRDVDALRQPVVTTPRSIQVVPCHLRELGIALDEQAVTPGQDRGHAGRTTARERVEHAATSRHVDVDQVGHQLHRFRGRVTLRIPNLWHLEQV
jgi:hypothetical protein